MNESLVKKLDRMLTWAAGNDRTFIPYGVHADALQSLAPWIQQVGAKSVLDCGSGPCPGPLALLLREHSINVAGFDLLDTADVQGDVHDLPFKDNSFDLVMSREGPEHFLIPYLAIAEMKRVSRKWLIICLPSDAPRCEESPGHLYVMGKQGWENVFRRLGLITENHSEFDITEEPDRPQWEWRWLLRKGQP